MTADLTNRGDVERLHALVLRDVGDIDILVQAAGITGSQGLFHEIDDEGWSSTIEVDLLGRSSSSGPSCRRCAPVAGVDWFSWRPRTPCSRTRTSCRTARRRRESWPSPEDFRIPAPERGVGECRVAGLHRHSYDPTRS